MSDNRRWAANYIRIARPFERSGAYPSRHGQIAQLRGHWAILVHFSAIVFIVTITEFPSTISQRNVHMPKSITQAMFARALRSRSALRRWLEDNHDEISGVLATQDLPPWSDLAAVARDHGVLDARGKPPTRHGVRKAWVALVARKRGKVSLESILADLVAS
jgi:hypothetical protein